MTRKKKGILVLVTILVICLLTGTVAVVAQKTSQNVVTVVPVDNIYMESYAESTNIEGNVSTSATQKVKVDKDSSIEKVYVKQGDQVHKGDNLVTFDMTLKELELSIARLTKKSQQLQLDKAKERLESLENGGAIEESDTTRDQGTVQEEISEDDNEVIDENSSAQVDTQGSYPGESSYLTAFWGPATPLTFSQETEGTPTAEPTEKPDEGAFSSDFTDSSGQEDGQDEFTSGSGEVEEVPEDVEGSTESSDTEQEPQEEIVKPKVDAKKAKMITKLTASTVAYSGDGTQKNPYTYICRNGTSQVTTTKGFLNLMMGYSPDGTTKYDQVSEPYYFQLIFYSGEELKVITVNPKEDFKEIDFPLTKDSKDPEVTYLEKEGTDGNGSDFSEFNQALDDAWDESETVDDAWSYDDSDLSDDTGDESAGITREEAIKNKKSDIKNLELDLKESAIKISKLEKVVANRTVKAKVNGVVKKMGDPDTGTYSGDAFMEVVSDQGLYISGAVSELLLDEFQEGMTINGTSYETGNYFEAKVTDVADYPADSGQYASGNPNVSYYPFTAQVEGDVQLSTDEYISLSFEKATADNTMSIIKAFVRTENGQSYVMVDKKGKLKKQYVTVGVSTDGYSIPVKSGLSMEDKVAFPYGKGVKEGAKTKEGTIDDVYGY